MSDNTVEALEARIKELEKQVADAAIWQLLAERAPDGISILAMNQELVYTNPAFAKMIGFGPNPIGLNMNQFLMPESLQELSDNGDEILQTGFFETVLVYRRKDGSTFRGHVSSFVLPGETLQESRFATITRDISEYLQAEEERHRLHEELIQAQQVALRELSTPLIPVAAGVLVMPLVGAIDSNRAQQIIESLLHEVSTQGAHTAIIDITGVDVVDTQVANALIRAAQSVRLLGASVMLTGIRPEVAQTLVGLGVDLNAIKTLSSLQMGIATALQAI